MAKQTKRFRNVGVTTKGYTSIYMAGRGWMPLTGAGAIDRRRSSTKAKALSDAKTRVKGNYVCF